MVESSTNAQAQASAPKFLAHPLLRRTVPSFPQDTPATIDGLPNTLLSTDTPLHELSHDLSLAEPRSNPLLAHTPNLSSPISQTVTRSSRFSHLPSSNHDAHDALEMKPLVHDALPNSGRHSAEAAHPGDVNSIASSSTAVQSRKYSFLPQEPLVTPHTPIAASSVFSRGASPLSLPKLDAYISALPAPSFPSFDSKNQAIFPPLDRLEASGKTLDDLEHNSLIPSWWQNRNTYFGSLASIFLSITVSVLIIYGYSSE